MGISSSTGMGEVGNGRDEVIRIKSYSPILLKREHSSVMGSNRLARSSRDL